MDFLYSIVQFHYTINQFLLLVGSLKLLIPLYYHIPMGLQKDVIIILKC